MYCHRNCIYLVKAVNIGLVHEIPVVFPAVRMWLSWLWKQLFAAGSTQQTSFEQKTCRVSTLVQLSDRY